MSVVPMSPSSRPKRIGDEFERARLISHIRILSSFIRNTGADCPFNSSDHDNQDIRSLSRQAESFSARLSLFECIKTYRADLKPFERLSEEHLENIAYDLYWEGVESDILPTRLDPLSRLAIEKQATGISSLEAAVHFLNSQKHLENKTSCLAYATLGTTGLFLLLLHCLFPRSENLRARMRSREA